jgi:hypothetical protein
MELTADCSAETQQTRKEGKMYLKNWKKNTHIRKLNPVKQSFRSEG